MAREIVITSVPRGVRPGRTGFQIAMRTAGLREDVCDQLEQLGVYRHLPPGSGPNPECYFHKLLQTGIGALHVLGRVVDAGADYSSRSNKLAHLVVIEPSELSALRQSSPATVLLAIEGRLARTWPGGPEERQQTFPVAGLPPTGPRICTAWQQSTGDAGWGGVLAEQAIKNKPVLVIAPDSSPQWCRQLLVLFEEALALVPPQRRWAVTFDTTVLGAAPLTWRGTYAGSPESASRQPGLLVIDLRQPQMVPADLSGSQLVHQARNGATVVPTQPAKMPGEPVPPPLDDEWTFPQGGPPPTPSGVPPPPPPRDRRSPTVAQLGRDGDATGTHWQAWLVWGAIALILLVGGPVGLFFLFDGPGQLKRGQAKRAIKAWARQDDGTTPQHVPPPTEDVWLAAYGVAKDSPTHTSPGLDRSTLTQVTTLLNDCLLTAAITEDSVKDLGDVEGLISTLIHLRTGKIDEAGLKRVGILLPEQTDAVAHGQIVEWLNDLITRFGKTPPAFGTVQTWIDALTQLYKGEIDEAGLVSLRLHDPTQPGSTDAAGWVNEVITTVSRDMETPAPAIPEKVPLKTIEAWLDARAKFTTGSLIKENLQELGFPTDDSTRLIATWINELTRTTKGKSHPDHTFTQLQDWFEALSSLTQGKVSEEGLRLLGMHLPKEKPEATKIVSWLNDLWQVRSQTPKSTPPPESLTTVRNWMDALTTLVALTQTGQSNKQTEASGLPSKEKLEALHALMYPSAPPPVTLDQITDALRNDSGLLAGVTTLAEASTKLERHVTDLSPKPTSEESWRAFVTRVQSGANTDREWPSEQESVVLIDRIPNVAYVPWDRVTVELGRTADGWEPKATRQPIKLEWRLHGLPGNQDSTWGAIQLEPDIESDTHSLVFRKQPDAPRDCGFVPIRFLFDKTDVHLQVTPNPIPLSWHSKTNSEASLLSAFISPADGNGSETPLEFALTDDSGNPAPLMRGNWEWQTKEPEATAAMKEVIGILRADASDASTESGVLSIKWSETIKTETITLDDDVASWTLDKAKGTLVFTRDTKIGSWNTRGSRWKVIDTLGSGAVNEGTQLKKLGLADREVKRVASVDAWKDIVVCLISENPPSIKKASPETDQPLTPNRIKAVLDKILPVKAARKVSEHSLLDWRRDLDAFIIQSKVLDSDYPHAEPQKDPSESSEDHDKRRRDWRRAREEHVRSMLASAVALKSFVRKQKKGGNGLTEEQAYALALRLELDNLILAKFSEKELRASLSTTLVKDIVNAACGRLTVNWAFGDGSRHKGVVFEVRANKER